MFRPALPCATTLLVRSGRPHVRSSAISGPGGAEQVLDLNSLWIWI
ncbi:hypothetical protein ACFQ2M_10855 [Kitasatospora saccharophila]